MPFSKRIITFSIIYAIGSDLYVAYNRGYNKLDDLNRDDLIFHRVLQNWYGDLLSKTFYLSVIVNEM
jgi:hypothetical protein